MKQKPSFQKNSKAQVIASKNPKDKIYRLAIFTLMLSLLSLLLLSCSGKKEVVENVTHLNAEIFQTAKEAIASVQNYEIVPNEKVCMVNDRYMGVSQIPIEANGTTNYGCYENCFEKLQRNLDDVRFGSNPLNVQKVDKALAIIVPDKDSGSVFYFASQEGAQSFINKNEG
ncbi:hypothetical protein [Zunongwangia sp. H14]|uniref:hypothetical protein n=1 Tax=Zunongwangia sp. H14 TaxID=3240792 RepID=UPI00356AB46C